MAAKSQDDNAGPTNYGHEMRALILSLLACPAFAEGFPVQRCVNLDQALEAPNEGEWGYTIARDHVTWIADQGFDTIRLPVKFSAHWDGQIDPKLQARVDEVIGWAMEDGLQVILDLHHFDELMTDPATHGDTLRAIWKALGTHYAGYDGGLIFELLNEPYENLDTAQAVALFQDIVPELRANHPDRWIIIEGAEWASIEALEDLPVIDDYTVLSFHYYSPSQFTHQLADWHVDPWPATVWGSAEERARLRDDFALAQARKAPLFLGEFGVTSNTVLPERINWIKAVRQEAEDHGIGWCHWGFARGFAIFDDTTADWLPGMQAALFSQAE